MSFLIILGLFVLGSFFGSFGSVLLLRMRHRITRKIVKGFAVGRSECPKCHQVLAWYDLIPLYSYFRYKGQCSHCGEKISSIYPTLEIVSGIVFALWGIVYLLPYLNRGGELSLMVGVLRWLLGLLLVWDMYTYELHVPLWFISLVIASIYTLVLVFHGEASRQLLLYAGVFFGAFLAIYLFGKMYVRMRFGTYQEGFGQGDVMLAPLLGFLFALDSIGQGSLFQLLLLFVLGSSLIGMIYYGCAVVVRKIFISTPKLKKHRAGSLMIPFLPAMIICYRVIVLIHAFSTSLPYLK